MYTVILTNLNANSDLRAVIGAICGILNIDKREAVERAKNLPLKPLTLAENLQEKEAKLMADMFSSMGAGIKTIPSFDEDFAKPFREIRPYNSRNETHFGCLVFFMLCIVASAVFVGLKYEWILEQFKPSPDKAENFLKKGKMGEARQSLRKQLVKKPDDTDILVLQGRFYIGAARERMNAENWKSYGEAGALPELDSAVFYLRKAESLNPKDGSISRWISIAEQMRRALPEAGTAIRRAISIDPQDVDNWNQLGSVLIDEENVSQAEQVFHNAFKIDPYNAATLKNLTILNLYYTKNIERAANFLFAFLDQKDAAKDMDSHMFRTDLATEMLGNFNPPLERLSPPELPLEEYERRRLIITSEPGLKNDPLLQEQLGLLYMSIGEIREAEACFIKAVQLNARMESSRKMLSVIYMKQQNYDKALSAMLAATNQGAKDTFFWKNIGVLQKYYKADLAESRKAFSRYFALGGDSYASRIKREI